MTSDRHNFQFTRHLLSCNNIAAGKWYANNKDFEPSAALDGIAKTIKFVDLDNNKAVFNSDKIFVSNLLRTWITTFLLYGVRTGADVIPPDNINLYISPFLKENQKDIIVTKIQRGNYPKKIKKTVAKFLKFLNSVEKIVKRLLPGIIVNYCKTVILNLPGYENNRNIQTIEITKDWLGNYAIKSDMNLITDTVGPRADSSFLVDADLKKFMSWFDNVGRNYYITPSSLVGNVHVVTHSQGMKAYIKSLKRSDKKILLRSAVENSNSWRFITDFKGAIHDDKTIAGVPIKKSEAKLTEKQNSELSLCGANGSIVPPPETTPSDLELLDIGSGLAKILMVKSDTHEVVLSIAELQSIEFSVRKLNSQYDKYIKTLYEQHNGINGYDAELELKESTAVARNGINLARKKIKKASWKIIKRGSNLISSSELKLSINHVMALEKGLASREVHYNNSLSKGDVADKEKTEKILAFVKHFQAKIELVRIKMEYAKLATTDSVQIELLKNAKALIISLVKKMDDPTSTANIESRNSLNAILGGITFIIKLLNRPDKSFETIALNNESL